MARQSNKGPTKDTKVNGFGGQELMWDIILEKIKELNSRFDSHERAIGDILEVPVRAASSFLFPLSFQGSCTVLVHGCASKARGEKKK